LLHHLHLQVTLANLHIIFHLFLQEKDEAGCHLCGSGVPYYRGQDWGDEDVCHHESKEKEGARGLGDAVDAYAASAVTPTNKTNFDEDIATGIAFGKFLLPTLPILQGPGPYLGTMG
jgi:hypothetical protein